MNSASVTSNPLKRAVHHQPALAGFGVADREFIHGAAHRMNSVSDTSNPLKRVALVGTGLVGLW